MPGPAQIPWQLRSFSISQLGIAFQDCFIVLAIVYVAAAVASVCIPGGEP